MSANCNPIHHKGKRNLYCPHYRNCLDHASKNHWEFWACQDCAHLNETKSATEVLLSPHNADLYYSLSPNIAVKFREYSY